MTPWLILVAGCALVVVPEPLAYARARLCPPSTRVRRPPLD